MVSFSPAQTKNMRLTGKLTAVSALTCLHLFSTPAAGQDASQTSDNGGNKNKILTTDALKVSTSRAAQRPTDMAQTVQIISAEEIQEQTATGTSLKETLPSLIPSLDFGSVGSRTNYGMNMRGRTAMIMIDGVSLMGARVVSRHLDSIDPFNIERIEVLSGASALHGGNATGGIINIITKHADSNELSFESLISGTSGFQADDDLDYRVAQSVSGGVENVRGRLSLAYSKTGNLYDGSGELIPPDTTQTSIQDTTNIDLFATIDAAIADDQSVSLTMQHYLSEQENDYYVDYGTNYAGFSDSSLITVGEGPSFDVEPSTERNQVSLSYDNQDFLGQSLIAQAYYRDEDLAFYPFPRTGGGTLSYLTGSEQNTWVTGVKTAMTSDFDDFEVTYGLDLNYESFEATNNFFDRDAALASGGRVFKKLAELERYPGYQVTTAAGFAQGLYDITDKLSIQGGVRREHIRTAVDSFVGSTQQINIARGLANSADTIPGGDVSYDVNLFNAGIKYDIDLENQIWFQFSQGFEIADPSKYYGKGDYTLVGTRYVLGDYLKVDGSSLQGVKTNNYELGWRHDGLDLQTQVAAYYAVSDKSIKANNTTLLIDVNDLATRTYGIEAMFNYNVDENWMVGASGHYVRKMVEQTDGSWDKEDATSASLPKTTAYVGWQGGDLGLKLQMSNVYDYQDSSDDDMDGYTLFDLKGGYNLPVGSLLFGINNLLDTDYQTIWGQRAVKFYSPGYGPASIFDATGRGRTFTMTYNVKY